MSWRAEAKRAANRYSNDLNYTTNESHDGACKKSTIRLADFSYVEGDDPFKVINFSSHIRMQQEVPATKGSASRQIP